MFRWWIGLDRRCYLQQAIPRSPPTWIVQHLCKRSRLSSFSRIHPLLIQSRMRQNMRKHITSRMMQPYQKYLLSYEQCVCNSFLNAWSSDVNQSGVQMAALMMNMIPALKMMKTTPTRTRMKKYWCAEIMRMVPIDRCGNHMKQKQYVAYQYQRWMTDGLTVWRCLCWIFLTAFRDCASRTIISKQSCGWWKPAGLQMYLHSQRCVECKRDWQPKWEYVRHGTYHASVMNSMLTARQEPFVWWAPHHF